VPATRWTNQDGVGCESCHGASGRWLGPHTTEEWQLTNGPSRKEAFGFVDTKSLASRARVCAGCHVGASSASGLLLRDVNHDLIAAGHPRLNFEFSAYLDNMPPHWNEKGQNADPAARLQRAANFPARAWAIGQFVTALASLELLEARAESGNTPWPEFSEYGCFSCHHDLRDAAWRQKRTSEPYRSSLAWGSWPMPMTRELASRFIADSAAQRFSESVQQLADFMAQPLPEQSAVRTRARQAAERLNPCLETIAARPLDEHDVATLLGIVNRREAWEGISSWDEAVQRYLALVPLYQAQLSLDPVRAPERRDLRRQIDRLFEKLRFEPGVDSPSGFDPGLLPVGR